MINNTNWYCKNTSSPFFCSNIEFPLFSLCTYSLLSVASDFQTDFAFEFHFFAKFGIFNILGYIFRFWILICLNFDQTYQIQFQNLRSYKNLSKFNPKPPGKPSQTRINHAAKKAFADSECRSTNNRSNPTHLLFEMRKPRGTICPHWPRPHSAANSWTLGWAIEAHAVSIILAVYDFLWIFNGFNWSVLIWLVFGREILILRVFLWKFGV
jgi:hypothetical protein